MSKTICITRPNSAVMLATPACGCGTQSGPTASAGSPGSFSGEVPADMAALQEGYVPSPTTAWTAGQYVVLGDGSEVFWNGMDWEEGRTPSPAITTSGPQTDPAYNIAGSGANPGAEVTLLFYEGPLSQPAEHGTVTADASGNFDFGGDSIAFSPATWAVQSQGIRSDKITLEWSAPLDITLTAEGAVATLTIDSPLHWGAAQVYTVDWGDGSTPEPQTHSTPVTHTYAADGTYTVTVTPTDDRYGWTSSSQDVTIALPLATMATAGNPGGLNGKEPDNIEEVKASPSRAWPKGRFVNFKGKPYHWDGSAWQKGKA